ncbi:putative PurR-regulated permease PerM [Methanolinea mesophila]|uniref:AI-2E family transporter n=1 Tax=Methanolinea mesophila TaxID=547055 RepID=UPI001AE6E791|nr:AI-2E family transporter [Methanolinea mesophila]MBP1928698.1 putative PurR-regulated permease PerM [Methanolinea mesophila]
MPSETFRYDLLTITLIFLILATVFVIYYPLAATIILGLTVAIVVHPLNRKLSARMTPARAAGLTTLLVAVVAGFALSFLAAILIGEGSLIFSMIRSITVWMSSIAPTAIISGAIVAETIDSVVIFIKVAIIPLLTSVPIILFHAFILFLTVYLFLLKGPDISRQVMSALPGRLGESIEKISGLVVNTLYAIYIVSVEVAIISFILSLPFYYLLGYPTYLPLAIMTGLAMFIPIFGPLLIMVFLVFYNLAIGDIPGLLVALFVIYPVALWLPGGYIRPRLMGRRVSIHPVLIMIGILGGISIMGIIGLILGPLFIALLVASYQILIDQLTMAKNQSSDQTPS